MSTEYTPTTAAVRATYLNRKVQTGAPIEVRKHAADFDRWLTAHDTEVRNDATEHSREAWVATLLAHTNLSAEEIGTVLGYLSEGYMRTRKGKP